MAEFNPDLIVEVTTACDRNCPGCYSPTLVSKESLEELYAKHPALFMTPRRLADCLSQHNRKDLVLSMRGGEPSRHLFLAELIEAARAYCKVIYVETHGRWILRDEPRTSAWLAAFREASAICKLSFDSMHGLKPEQLKEITARLDQHRVAWQIAITEVTRAEYEAVKASCPWVPESRILFQEKVANHNQLVHPVLGILNVDGQALTSPSTRDTFKVLPLT